MWGAAGEEITGRPEDAFIPDMTIIPNNTTAPGQIKSINLVDRINGFSREQEKYYEFTYKLMAGDFKGQEVTQKIKCFLGEQKSIGRALNMLKLIMDLCGYKPAHGNELTSAELLPMVGKILGLRIREWQIEKSDGKIMEGNFVSEVWPINDKFVTESGIKLLAKPSKQMPFSSGVMQPGIPDFESDEGIPF
jgi:hypothetical protein